MTKKSIICNTPDFELHNLYNKPAKAVSAYLGTPEKVEKYSINTCCETGYYQIFHYYSKGLTITTSKSGSKPSSMDDSGRSAMNSLRRRAYCVESIMFKSNYKNALFNSVYIGMNEDIAKKKLKEQLEILPNWEDYFWLDKKNSKGIEINFENNILMSAEIREIYSTML